MEYSVFTPEKFPMHSWNAIQDSPTWVDRLEDFLDWLLGEE